MRKPCFDKHGTNKGAWSKQEDQKLIDYIGTHGVGCWGSLPKSAGLVRCGKSCRVRWINYLRPDMKRGDFAEDEEDLIIKLHALLGNRWSLIAGRLPGRTDNEVKNYWNSHLSRKLVSMGIDPDNHRLSQIQHIHRPQSSETPGTVASKLDQEQLRKECGSLGTPTPTMDDNGTESEAASCVEGTSCMLPDLNLDLTVSIPN